LEFSFCRRKFARVGAGGGGAKYWRGLDLAKRIFARLKRKFRECVFEAEALGSSV